MKRIRHIIEPEKVRDLLDTVPRACVAFVNAGVVHLLPAEFRFEEGRYWIGISGGASGPAPRPGEPVKLLIDEGTYYFDMRGIWIRGRTLFSEERPEGGSAAVNWFQLVPEKFLAWDFGEMREVRSDERR